MTRYDPNRLLDHLAAHFNAKSDAALARALEVNAPMISKVRHNRMPLGSGILLRMHEVSGWSIQTLKNILGDRRAVQRLSTTQQHPNRRLNSRNETTPFHNVSGQIWAPIVDDDI